MPFVFIELKGAAYNTETINWLWAEALEAGMVDYLALYILDDDQPVSIAQQTHWQGQLIRGFKVTHGVLLCWHVQSAYLHCQVTGSIDCQ